MERNLLCNEDKNGDGIESIPVPGPGEEEEEEALRIIFIIATILQTKEGDKRTRQRREYPEIESIYIFCLFITLAYACERYVMKLILNLKLFCQ